ncbi:MAG: hypothetical protein A3C27_01700 [Candidatus Levybacteria bacterium RIFCSPHIGHO2_02_FULL_39_36]|nr:MAG: hypothetical protein UT56_C0004G0014 [Candidatus Levybacteria bacterium GW2011_GWB1_39_7]OGH15375.1 MAG: hypothetical protein A2689_02185 [Candidatus Levybacteria bacterium RIFCSPHIGHO2_01_FULL_38_96]OGH27580.1 MAG: hypothetical protein A3C27_01700 [Candidatus Levybacteria bacterium RIFCSPHIGHO2_02_FULL_39_36]OGH36039.1 MAG: hypothetical protein A3B43_02760 [Candidatus Levybacteria bacterium RIFCSPLOWO2_01_FULL_38_120]
MKFFIKQKFVLCEIIILFVLSLIPFLWFAPNHIIVGLDSGYPVDYEKYLDQRVFTWMASHNFGVDFSAEVGVLPYSSLAALLSHIGIPYFSIQKVLFSFWFFVMLGSTYLFLRYLYSQDKYWFVRLGGTFFYIFNLHLYSFMIQGEQPILASYTLLPLFTLILIKFIRNELSMLKTAVLLNFAYLLFGAGGVRGVPLIGPTILMGATIVLYHFMFSWKKERYSYIKKFAGFLIAFLAIFILFNAYYIIPFISSFSQEFNSQVTIAGGPEGAISWAKFISSNASFTNLFRLQGDNNWYSKPYLFSNAYLENPILILLSFAFSILAWSAPLLVKDKKEKRLLIYFAILALISLFLAAGAHSPFGALYTALMKFVPGFATFRSAWYKFMPGLFFSYSVLLGVAAYYLLQKIKYLSLRTVLGIGLLLFILAYNYPYFQNSNFVHNKPFSLMVDVPEYVKELVSLRNTSSDDYRTLVIPHANTEFTIKTYSWGYWSSYPIFPLMTDKSFVQYDTYLFNDDENAFIKYIYQKLREKDYDSFNKVVKLAHIRYVLLTKDVVYDYYFAPMELPSFYENILQDTSRFTPIWKRGEWVLYEINDLAQLKKIDSISSLTMNSSPVQTIPALLDNSEQPFVLQSQIPETLRKKLPISEIYASFKCLSCTLLTDPDVPIIYYSRVNPGSWLYKIKMQNDLKKMPHDFTSSSSIYSILGFSMKRVSELDIMKPKILVQKVKDDALLTFRSLSANITVLESYLHQQTQSTYDFDLLKSMLSYLTFERENLQKIYAGDFMREDTQLISSLLWSTSHIEKLETELKDILHKYNWETTFIYDLAPSNQNTRTVFIDHIGVQKDAQNKSLLPYAYEIDGRVASLSAETFSKGLELRDIPSYASRLTLFFPSALNLLNNLKPSSVKLPNSTLVCMSSPVQDYLWNKKYRLSVTSTNSSAPKTVFIKRDYSYVATWDYTPEVNNYFTPDITLSPKNTAGEKTSFDFSGKPNDKGASVYLCTDPEFDPVQVYSDISVKEILIPQVYAMEQKGINTKKQPKVDFTRINPTHYRVKVSNATEPYILSFLEGYSPNWRLLSNSKLLPDHFRLNAYANGWYVDKQGSYTLDIVFYTQTTFYKGLIITFISVILGGLFLLFPFLKRKVNNV